MLNTVQLLEKQKEIEALNRRIQRAEDKVAFIKDDHEKRKAHSAILTEHAGWDLGYWESRVSTLEEWRNSLQDEIDRGCANKQEKGVELS